MLNCAAVQLCGSLPEYILLIFTDREWHAGASKTQFLLQLSGLSSQKDKHDWHDPGQLLDVGLGNASSCASCQHFFLCGFEEFFDIFPIFESIDWPPARDIATEPSDHFSQNI